jgi:hypothetical protein
MPSQQAVPRRKTRSGSNRPFAGLRRLRLAFADEAALPFLFADIAQRAVHGAVRAVARRAFHWRKSLGDGESSGPWLASEGEGIESRRFDKPDGWPLDATWENRCRSISAGSRVTQMDKARPGKDQGTAISESPQPIICDKDRPRVEWRIGVRHSLGRKFRSFSAWDFMRRGIHLSAPQVPSVALTNRRDPRR